MVDSSAATDPGRILDESTSSKVPWEALGWAFVGLGIVLRLIAFACNFPLWWDEAFVAVNLLRRGYAGLTKPLDYGQVCPLLFLWAELFAVRLLGFQEWSLRLFPFLCSVASVVLFRLVAGRILEGRALLIAVAVFAVSVHPIRHAADLKPYSADLLVALMLQGIALEWTRHPERSRWLWVLGAFSPFAILLSHPSIFILGGIGLAITKKSLQTRSAGLWIAWFAYGVVSLTAYGLTYVFFTHPQASAASPGMKEMWFRSFPPLDSVVAFSQWLVIVHSGDMLAYPCGGERGGSSLSLVVCLIGLVVLIQQGSWTRLGILIGPLGLAIVAAALRLYPYGGPAPHGSAARIMQYAAPALCLLIGLGASKILEWVRSPSIRDRLVRFACIALVVIGIAPIVNGFSHPYRSYQAEAARRFARGFWTEIGRDAEVADLRWDFDVADWDSIHLGIAVSLCNEAIYSPSRRSGGPNLAKVSATHPLRCVLGVAPEANSHQVVEWLEKMREIYDFQGQKTIRVPVSEPGRKPEVELYQIFEFLPKSAGVSKEVREFQSVKGR